MDELLKRQIESIQPNSNITKQIIQNLGYDPADLQFKEYHCFASVSKELQEQKYEHYRRRVLSKNSHLLEIVTEVQNVRKVSRRSTFLMPTKLAIPIQEANSETSTSKDNQEISNYRAKVVQNLIFEELQQQKQRAEYLLKEKNMKSNQSTTQSKMSKSTRRSKRLKSASSDGYSSREQYFITEIETQNRVQEVIKLKNNQQTPKPLNFNNVISTKQRQKLDFELFQINTLQELEMKEQKVKQKLQQFRDHIREKQQLKNRVETERKMIKSSLDQKKVEEQIIKQCQKLEAIQKKKLEAQQKESSRYKDRKKEIEKKQEKKQLRLLKLDQELKEKQTELVQDIQQKTELVNRRKTDQQFYKSMTSVEKQKIREDDIRFNKYHLEQLKLKNEVKILEKSGTFKEQYKLAQQQLILSQQQSVRQNLMEKQREMDCWFKIEKAAALYKDPELYETYRDQLKAKMLNKSTNIVPIAKQSQNIIQDLFSSELAQRLLIPDGLQQEIKQEQDKAKNRSG